MKIAEVSEHYGLSADTLRYYERVGLIPPGHAE
jgi:DNA-binding transcriptional MerR regulator